MGDYEKADKYYKKVLEMEAPRNIKNLAKDGLREIAVSSFKAKGFRADAIFYLLGALKLFEQKTESEINSRGISGNDPICELLQRD